MNILVIGNGAREHAIVYKLAQSPQCEKIYCAKGNAGTSDLATNVDISPLDFKAIVEFCKQNSVEFVVVGPEEPLANGIVDYLSNFGISAFGPTKKAAMLESSKSFCKNLCKNYKIPTAAYEVFDDFDRAFEYIKNSKYPLVIKADGLAAGKGVVIAYEEKEALAHLQDCFNNKKFGQAGSRVVIEEFLEGEELSYMVFCDGKNFVSMPASQDHKRVFDNDLGPNTGGMGAYAKAPIVNDIEDDCKKIIKQTIDALNNEGIEYRGVLYAGLMVVNGKPYVLEYNCRFGDPETQVVLPLIKSDLLDIMIKCTNSSLNDYKIECDNRFAVSVVLASKGYPSSYDTNKPISGLDELGDVLVFHAGTYKKDGKIFTNGGRVLNVVALDADFRKAIKKAYDAVGKIHFEGMHFRRDIGKKALKYL
jgi:phosphoribosylamine--glycine ligase